MSDAYEKAKQERQVLRAAVIGRLSKVAANKDGKARLSGKVGIITGVGPAKGIGSAAARLFAREGAAHLFLLDVSRELPGFAQQLQKEFPNTKVSYVVGDAASAKVVKDLIDTVIKDEERLDFYFSNAGVSNIRPKDMPPPTDDVDGTLGELAYLMRSVREVPDDDFAEILRINTFSGFLAIKYASVAMEKAAPHRGKPIGGGSIVLTASVAGLRASGGPVIYSVSKAGVASLAKSGAYDLAGKNIRVNAICPGLVQTDLTKVVFNLTESLGMPGAVDNLAALQRHALPHEIAHMALFLASDDSSYVNGQPIAVCGGLSASLPFPPELADTIEQAKL